MNESSWISLIIGLAIASWTLATVILYLGWQYKKSLYDYLTDKKIKEKKRKLTDKIAQGLLNLAVKFAPVGYRFKLFVDLDRLERKLSLAGNPKGMNVGSFLGLRFILFVSALFLAELWMFLGLPLASFLLLFLPVAAFVGPTLWIRVAAKERQERIGLDLPDFLDGMSVTLQAGIPLDSAMNQVVETMVGPLAEELNRLNREVELGVPREEAYRRLVNRNDCDELETLVNALVQGSHLGVPIANTFKVMAGDMRITRFNKVKEIAAKAGPKVTLVTSFVITPGVLVAILGLILLNVMYNPGFIGGGLR